MPSVPTVTTVLTATLNPLWWATRFALNPKVSTVLSRKDAHASTDLCKCFADCIEEALRDCPTSSAEERWHHIRVAIYNSAMDAFGKRERKNTDWFEAGIAELEPAIAAKWTALLDYQREPSDKTPGELRKARNDAQWIACRLTNNSRVNLCQSIQLSPNCGNIRAMYDSMKIAFSPSTTPTAP